MFSLLIRETNHVGVDLRQCLAKTNVCMLYVPKFQSDMVK